MAKLEIFFSHVGNILRSGDGHLYEIVKEKRQREIEAKGKAISIFRLRVLVSACVCVCVCVEQLVLLC